MKCAAELVLKATTRKAEIEVTKKMQEEIAKRNLIIDTIKWCEKVGQHLESLADNGKSPCYHFVMSYTTVMEETRKAYADRRLSWEYGKVKLDINTVKEWFAQYCFKVEIEETWGWVYGFGQVSFDSVTIKPDLNCLK